MSDKVYVKAVHGRVGFDKITLKEGEVKQVAMTDALKRLVDRNIVKVFNNREEAEKYKFVPASEKMKASIKAFHPDAKKEDKEESLVTPTGLPSKKAVELEKKLNGHPHKKDTIEVATGPAVEDVDVKDDEMAEEVVTAEEQEAKPHPARPKHGGKKH